MPFPPHEREAMLALKGVGATVIARLEQLGYEALAQLRCADPAQLCVEVANLLRTSCWRNSPQARASISAIVRLANQLP